MAKSRYKFFDTVYNEDMGNTQKGFMTQNLGELLRTDRDILYTIPIDQAYRPDLIANQFYGNPKLFWVIVYANDINNSPEGFYQARVIRVPSFDRVLEIT